MTIELVGANVVMSAPIPPTNSSIVRNPNVAFRRSEVESFFVVILHDNNFPVSCFLFKCSNNLFLLLQREFLNLLNNSLNVLFDPCAFTSATSQRD